MILDDDAPATPEELFIARAHARMIARVVDLPKPDPELLGVVLALTDEQVALLAHARVR